VSNGVVRFTKCGSVAAVVFDRPEARNAITMAMYDQLATACNTIGTIPEVRVAIFRGAGEAFAAGTDIREFLSFTSPERTGSSTRSVLMRSSDRSKNCRYRQLR
jgi:enoyl-CoA hydratase